MYRNLAESTMRLLAEAGATFVFGVPGGGANLEMIGAAEREGIRFILAHNETAAAMMASTHGLISGFPGVCIVTRGPGLLSAANGVAQATLDRFPLILLSDAVPESERARIAHQLVDQRAVMAPITKWSATISPTNVEETVQTAVRLSLTQPQGAVHLDFDPTGTPPTSTAIQEAPSKGRSNHSQRSLENAASLVAESSYPLLVVGAEAIPYGEALSGLVEAHNIPVLTTYHAKGLLPESSRLACGLFTNGLLERPLLEKADLILVVGVDPVELYPGPWVASAPVIAVNPWPLTHSYYPLDHELTGPIDTLVSQLLRSLRTPTAWQDDIGSTWRERTISLLSPPDQGALTPHSVMSSVRELVDSNTTITVDSGAHFLVAMPILAAEVPRQILISNGLATMGFALPAAIGAAIARPEGRVICITGDGGLGMGIAELETVARLGLNLAVVVLNDAALSMIRLKQEPHHGGAEAVEYGLTNFAGIAGASGMNGSVVEDAQGIEDCLKSEWPVLVDARIDPSSYVDVIRASRG